jgi:hypothetical protein
MSAVPDRHTVAVFHRPLEKRIALRTASVENAAATEQFPVSGVSMKYSFDAKSDAATEKKKQYYCMLGTRGIWQDGWKASAIHAPLTGRGDFDKDEQSPHPAWRGAAICVIVVGRERATLHSRPPRAPPRPPTTSDPNHAW